MKATGKIIVENLIMEIKNATIFFNVKFYLQYTHYGKKNIHMSVQKSDQSVLEIQTGILNKKNEKKIQHCGQLNQSSIVFFSCL